MVSQINWDATKDSYMTFSLSRWLCPITIILILASCGGPKKKAEAAKPDLVYPEQGLFSTDFKYIFFGQIGYRDRAFQEDTLLFPPIDGLAPIGAKPTRISI